MLQKRDPLTGQFISRAEFYARYPDGLTDEQYTAIRNAARLAKREHGIEQPEQTPTAEVKPEPTLVAGPTQQEVDTFFGPDYDPDYRDDFTARGCLAAVVIMAGTLIALTALFHLI